MTRLILTRGIPASGKSTYAKVWVTAAPNRVRVNRDDLRFMMYGVYFGEPIDEQVVTKIQHGLVVSALKAGNDVIVDDTNLVDNFVRKLVQLGHRYCADVTVKDFDISLGEAIARNWSRDRKVPEDVIRTMHSRYTSRKDIDVTAPVVRKYDGTPGKPDAYLFDIDGTIAQMNRSPYEWRRVGDDTPINHVIEVVNSLSLANYKIVFMSGRDGSCEQITRDWLDANIFWDYDNLFMRAAGDMRADNIIKAELFDTYVRDNYNVMAVFDDRDQVVDAWRSMGIPCYQVAPGDF